MLKTIKRKTKLLSVLLVLVFSLPSVLGLLHKGFPLTDDGNWMIIRFSAFYEVLRSGEFPVRFLSRLNNGFGYPVADFLYPLFMYLAVPLKVLGLSFVDSIRALLILSVLSSSIFAFLWFKKIFDNISSFVASIYYTYFPYHLFDIYKRGSVGEALSLSVLPFVLWQIERRSLIFASVGIALLIAAHNTLAVLFLAFILLYMFVNISVSKNKKQDLYFYLLIISLGFGISAFFWIPAVFDLQYTVFSNTLVSGFTNYFSNFNLFGLPSLVVIIFTIILLIKQKVEIKKYRLTVLMLFISLISLFFATELSSISWRFLPVSFIQFPFRFLSLTIVSVSFLSAAVVSGVPNKIKTPLAFILVLILLPLAPNFILGANYQLQPDSFYSTNQDTTTVRNEYMPKWVKKIPQFGEFEKITNINGKEKINLTQVSPNKIEFNTYLSSDRKVKVNTVYFPGWEGNVNGKKTTIDYTKDGFINLDLKKGSNFVSVIFKETGVRFFSDLISLISFISLFIIYYVFKMRKIML